MTARSKPTRPPGAWETIRTAIASAPRTTRRALLGIWGAGVVMIGVQFAFDFGGFHLPLEVAEAIGVTLGALAMGGLGSVMMLQGAQQRAAGEARAVWAETKTPTQIVLVLPLAAAAGGAGLAAAIGITVVRALLGSPEHYAIAAFMAAYLVAVGRIIFGATRTLYVYGRRQAAAVERARAELAEARVQALQAQMNPHFLFNTLNTVASLVRRDPTSAERTVEHLSSVLRRTLDRSTRPMSTVADEIDYVRAYLAIEQQRFGDRLQVEWRVDSWTRSRTIPTMTLQPLVENALKHGISGRLDGGAIRIAITEVGGGLRLIVEDDGPGFASPYRDGTGLGNLRQRLEAQYGSTASLRVEHPPVGARVVLDLPPAPLLAGEA